MIYASNRPIEIHKSAKVCWYETVRSTHFQLCIDNDLLTVGASLLAMVVNDAAYLLTKRSAFESIASKLAPTVGGSLSLD